MVNVLDTEVTPDFLNSHAFSLTNIKTACEAEKVELSKSEESKESVIQSILENLI